MALQRKITDASPIELNPLYSQGGEAGHAPRHTLPEGELDPDVAYQLVRDELMLDGNSRLNLATFVTTWMEPQAQRLMAETFDKNMIDKDEYPRTAEIELRCVNMLEPAVELARHRGGHRHVDHRLERGGDARRHGAEVALARPPEGRRQADRQAQHGHGRQRPGLLGEVLPLLGRRAAPRPDGGRPLPPQRAKRRSSTATRTRSASCRCSARRSTAATSRSPTSAPRSTSSRPSTGLDIPVHVDAASGGFIAPFLDPDLVLGLPAAARAVDQRVGAQVRPRVPGRRLGRSGATPTRCPTTSCST